MLKKIRYGSVILGLLLTPLAHAVNCNSNSAGNEGFSACDLAFASTPTFSCGGVLPQTGVYTIRNDTPISMKLNYFRIQNNDALPTADVTITANTCGAQLAAGATCTVTVSLTTDGPYSRILQVGIDSRQVELDSPVITPTTGCNTPTPGLPSTPPSTCALGTTSTFATLGGTTITNTGATVLNGDLGLSPGTSVTGFPPGTVNGTQFITDATAAAAQVDLTTLYTCLQTLPCTTVIGTTDQAGATLTAGAGAEKVFCSASSVLNSGVLTLSGDATSVIVIQAGSTLTFGPGASVVLTGGLLPGNVFWQVGSSATLNSTSLFKGTIAALSSITMNTGATMVGRALARNAAVTFDTNTINLP